MSCSQYGYVLYRANCPNSIEGTLYGVRRVRTVGPRSSSSPRTFPDAAGSLRDLHQQHLCIVFQCTSVRASSYSTSIMVLGGWKEVNFERKWSNGFRKSMMIPILPFHLCFHSQQKKGRECKRETNLSCLSVIQLFLIFQNLPIDK